MRSRRSRPAPHETLNLLAGEVCAEAGVDAERVYEMVLCGNVTMTQIALGIDPEPLAVAPFIMTARRLPPVTAADFGVRIHPRAPAFVFPALGAYVGGDIIAGMLATGLTRDRRLRLFIDVGTNSEIALGSNERVVATAAPAGPAFEAAQIRCGMRAAEGAIEGVKIAGDDLDLEVIGDAPPVGMCGSGLVDAVAQLVSAGLLDHSGRFVPDEEAAEAIRAGAAAREGRRGAGVRARLARRRPANAIYLSQRDVRELQFAKASIATGWHILLSELGVTAADITQVLLAGASAPICRRRAPSGSASCRSCRCRGSSRPGTSPARGRRWRRSRSASGRRPTPILEEVEYVELSGRSDFNDMFVDQLAFPG